MTYNHNDNHIYFTDSGKSENNQLFPNQGSVYMIDLESKVVKPLLSDCLSYPVDIIYDYVNKAIYIAEMLSNRIIRIKQSRSGVYFSSVFFQFSGRVGPRALAIDELGNLYCARFEYQDTEIIDSSYTVDGLITVIDSNGNVKGEITIPKGPEIISLLIPSKKKDSLFYTLNENKTLYKIKLSAFISEIESIEMQVRKHI